MPKLETLIPLQKRHLPQHGYLVQLSDDSLHIPSSLSPTSKDVLDKMLHTDSESDNTRKRSGQFTPLHTSHGNSDQTKQALPSRPKAMLALPQKIRGPRPAALTSSSLPILTPDMVDLDAVRPSSRRTPGKDRQPSAAAPDSLGHAQPAPGAGRVDRLRGTRAANSPSFGSGQFRSLPPRPSPDRRL